MRRAADLYAGAAKTDPRDAWVLADYARRNPDRLTWTEISYELLVRLRVLNDRDTDLAGDANRTINRCRDALLAVSPALERVVGHRLTQPGMRDVLAKWPTPSALTTAGRTKIRSTISKTLPTAGHHHHQPDPRRSQNPDRVVTRRNHMGRNHHRPDRRPGTHPHPPLPAHSNHPGDVPGTPPGKVLVTLCGFGPRTGARTLAEIGNPHRFQNGARLAAYAGLAPVNHRSGKSINRASQHRGGNHRLKNAMFIAAFVATQHDPTAKIYYQRKRSEGKHHNAAVICVARRRCDLILAMLKNQTPYNPTPKQHPKTT